MSPPPCQGKAPLGPRAIRKEGRFSRRGSVLYDTPECRPASIPSVRDFPTAALLLSAPFLLRWGSRAACPESPAVPLRFLGKLCLTSGQAHDKIITPMKRAYFLCADYGICPQTLDHLDIGRQTMPIQPYSFFMPKKAQVESAGIGIACGQAKGRFPAFCFSRGRTS